MFNPEPVDDYVTIMTRKLRNNDAAIFCGFYFFYANVPENDIAEIIVCQGFYSFLILG